ncbi:hypothetical protein V6N13_142399 [Hibiscus sabdariffa]
MNEAQVAVERANNRLMDGFRIKVFIDTKALGAHKVSAGGEKKGNLQEYKAEESYKGVDGRSYKEVLMSKITTVNEVTSLGCPQVLDGQLKEEKVELSSLEKGLLFVTTEKDKEWLRKCLVGKISAMYDAEFVQQVLQSEGFKVKVSCWSGFFAIIHFEEEEQINIFWDLKDSIL